MTDGLDRETFQRLVLANQYEILARLDPDKDEPWSDLSRQVLDWWPLEGLPAVSGMHEMREDPLTAEDQDYVRDVLELFDALQRALAEAKPGKAGRLALFPGFCGNHEGKYLSYMKWLRAHESFTYVRLANPGDPNSHWPMIETYNRMLDAWSDLGCPSTMSAAEAESVLNARTPPANPARAADLPAAE